MMLFLLAEAGLFEPDNQSLNTHRTSIFFPPFAASVFVYEREQLLL
jgi:hypothetical protein